MSEILFWTGVVTWIVCSVVGAMWLTDKLAEWIVDSARFKLYVVGYLRSKHRK